MKMVRPGFMIERRLLAEELDRARTVSNLFIVV
jgi:hypothetical protein